MLYCGFQNNSLIEKALVYLPTEIMNSIKNEVVFICLGSDACRLSRNVYENNEIIILSQTIFPKGYCSEDDPAFRYFIFCVLHEVAHAIKKHKSPLFDNLTPQEIEDQEREADQTAISWFNSHIDKMRHPDLKPITTKEIEEQKETNQKKWNEFLSHV